MHRIALPSGFAEQDVIVCRCCGGPMIPVAGPFTSSSEEAKDGVLRMAVFLWCLVGCDRPEKLN